MQRSIKKRKIRQKIRKGIVLLSFFLFPATFYYLSPYLIIDATMKGVVNGSPVMFFLMFISSLLVGRGFCGWVCPGAGCQEALFLANNKKVNKGDAIKWIIWIPWISMIAILAIRQGGYKEIDFFYKTRHGLSIGDVHGLIAYLIVLFLIVIPALIVGKRSFCHHICWMAPFMILGRKFRNALNWPSLQLHAEPEFCSNCHMCTRNCPMSLPVEDMVRLNHMEHTECILCGSCIDGCRDNIIRYAFKKCHTN